MGTVLVVDYEPVVTRFVRVALEREQHRVETAASAAEASQVAERLECIDVLIVEVLMGGRKIAERLLSLHPHMKVIYLSTWPRESLEEEGQLDPGAIFIAKPFLLPHIQNTVTALLAL